MYGYSDRIHHALAFAAKHHAPFAPAHAAPPFLAQPANVAIILARHGLDEITLTAGVLHHVLDLATDANRSDLEEKINRKFGPVVLSIACDASTPRCDETGEALPWRIRKRQVMRRLAAMEPRALDIRCAGEIHECGSAINLVQRLGPEYLEAGGLAHGLEVVAWYTDCAEAMGRRIDWPGHGMRAELAGLGRRLATLLPPL